MGEWSVFLQEASMWVLLIFTGAIACALPVIKHAKLRRDGFLAKRFADWELSNIVTRAK